MLTVFPEADPQRLVDVLSGGGDPGIVFGTPTLRGYTVQPPTIDGLNATQLAEGENLQLAVTLVGDDEYQDVDDRQEELIRFLSGDGISASVTAVGDDDQALYGFRGASVRNILTFEQRYPNVQAIVCDLEMIGMNGFEFLKVRQQTPEIASIPTIMLTSRAGDKHRMLTEELGATAYLTKPYDDGDLLSYVAQYA